MTTISASSTIGIVLSSPTYANPVMINPGVTITGPGNAIYASSGFWTIINSGSIATPGGTGSGIQLDAGGVVNNQGGGVIGEPASNPSAIYIQGGAGTVINAGTINAGVWLQSGGTVTNQLGATIVSGSTSGGYGVGLHGGGTVTNAGEITGLLIGMDLSTDGGTVTNQAHGTISGPYAGILLGFPGQIGGGGGELTNQSGGTISGDSGVFGGGGSATVINAGAIIGTSAGTVTHGGITLVTGSGVSMSAGGAVTNQSGGTIGGASVGVYFRNVAGTVVNDGTISGTAGRGVALMAGGAVSNSAAGTISSDVSIGLYVTGSPGAVDNAGDIFSSGSHGGVDLFAGGYLTNRSSGTISSSAGTTVYITGGAGTVVNDGQIVGGGTHIPVHLHDGGTIINQAGGTVTGTPQHYAIYTTGAAATVTNYGLLIEGTNLNFDSTVTNETGGTIINHYANGALFHAGGSLVNASGGIVSGQNGSGVYFTSGAGTVISAGLISATGSNKPGIRFSAGGYVNNQPGGTITSTEQDGIVFRGGTGTLVNSGVIVGSGNGTTSYDGVIFNQTGGTVTNAQPGTITGPAIGVFFFQGGGTVTNAGSIGGTSEGVVSESGGVLTNAASGVISGNSAVGIYVAAGTIINDGQIRGGEIGAKLAAGGSLIDAGTISATGTAVAFYGSGSNLLVLDPGFGLSGLVSGSVSASNTLELASAASAGTVVGLGTQFVDFGSIAFDAGANWFVAGDTAGLAGTISGFAFGDTIEVTGVTATGSSYSGGVLTLDEAAGSATLDLSGSFTSEQLIVTPVAGGTDVSVACFLAGTRIATRDGEIAVEDLRTGDQIVSAFGGTAPVVWVGHRRLDCRRHPRPREVWPVRVAAHAFGADAPRRDLLMSPDHAVYVGGVLMPIRYLCNGSSIVQEARDTVTYFHVELPEHDVLLAERLAAESYLDTGNRAAFADVGDAVLVHAEFVLQV